MDPEIQEAVKKCNPQKAILAMGDYLDKYEGRLDNAQTTADAAQQTAEQAQATAVSANATAGEAKTIAQGADTKASDAVTSANTAQGVANEAKTIATSAQQDAGEATQNALDAKTQAQEALKASGTATTTANEALSVAQAADTLAGQAQNRANEAYTYAGNVETALTATNVDLNNLKTATNPAIKEISPVTNTSTVNLNLTRINGSGTVAMPVASTTQAGVLNANDYKQMQDYAGRIGALEGSLAIYPVTLPSDNPSSEQITNAYTSQYPDAPNPPLDNTTVSDVTRKITYRYTSIGNTWIQVSYEVTQQFTNSSPGTIKGSTSPGMVSANTDGTGSLNGYDALVATGNASLNGLTAQGSATTISLVTSKNDGSQSVITLPQASNTQGGTISAVDYQKLQNSGVPIFTNDQIGAIKGSTLAGKISANADGTGTLNGYDDLATDTANAYYDLHINQTAGIVQIEATHNDGTADQLTIPAATTTNAGVMNSTQATQLSNSYANATKGANSSSQWFDLTTNAGSNTRISISQADATQAGLLNTTQLSQLQNGGYYNRLQNFEATITSSGQELLSLGTSVIHITATSANNTQFQIGIKSRNQGDNWIGLTSFKIYGGNINESSTGLITLKYGSDTIINNPLIVPTDSYYDYRIEFLATYTDRDVAKIEQIVMDIRTSSTNGSNIVRFTIWRTGPQ